MNSVTPLPYTQSGQLYPYTAKGRGKYKIKRTMLDKYNETLQDKTLHATKGYRKIRDIEVDYLVSNIRQRKVAFILRQRKKLYQDAPVKITTRDPRARLLEKHEDRNKYSAAHCRQLRRFRGVGGPVHA